MELYSGLAVQYAGFSSRFIKRLNGEQLSPNELEIQLSNVGVYGVSELVYYPFKRKNVFLSVEPFLGINRYKTKSTINDVANELIDSYSDTFTFFNYGSTQTLGYRFKRLSIAANIMASYKGFLDNGRRRIGDFDSFLFPGIQLAWTLD